MDKPKFRIRAVVEVEIEASDLHCALASVRFEARQHGVLLLSELSSLTGWEVKPKAVEGSS